MCSDAGAESGDREADDGLAASQYICSHISMKLVVGGGSGDREASVRSAQELVRENTLLMWSYVERTVRTRLCSALMLLLMVVLMTHTAAPTNFRQDKPSIYTEKMLPFYVVPRKGPKVGRDDGYFRERLKLNEMKNIR